MVGWDTLQHGCNYRYINMAAHTSENNMNIHKEQAKNSMKKKAEKISQEESNPHRDKEVSTLAMKLGNTALNNPLRFTEDAPRPQSKGTSRFGMLSHHSFFSRHNPHPHRVTHIQGLNGNPVCIVNDDWSVCTPLSPHPMIKPQFSQTVLGVPGAQIPLGDPHGNLIPKLGTGSISEAWREELRDIAARVCLATEAENNHEVKEVRRGTQYSAQTGRIIPPSSRLGSRQGSRQASRNYARNKKTQGFTPMLDQELLVLEILCQILQTDSLTAVQQWLLTAGQKEKDLVMGMIQTAAASNLQALQNNNETQERFQLLSSGLMSRGQDLYLINQEKRYNQQQKIEPIKEDKPERIGTAEILQIHVKEYEKPAEENN
ncbi:protein TBATA isoform X2 [Protopterus annectens]|uniref:protein TBATA isoform X2 n=1 Tax=Protopterus annectens TaxID=7888 RepID=UPI001CFA132D|nr:protein TBATA isoform X2 [Protopterus annectens]